MKQRRSLEMVKRKFLLLQLLAIAALAFGCFVVVNFYIADGRFRLIHPAAAAVLVGCLWLGPISRAIVRVSVGRRIAQGELSVLAAGVASKCSLSFESPARRFRLVVYLPFGAAAYSGTLRVFKPTDGATPIAQKQFRASAYRLSGRWAAMLFGRQEILLRSRKLGSDMMPLTVDVETAPEPVHSIEVEACLTSATEDHHQQGTKGTNFAYIEVRGFPRRQ